MIDYTRESKLDVEPAVEKLTNGMMANNWGVLSTIYVKKIFAGELDTAYDGHIMNVCAPALAQKGLSINKQIGYILPCNIEAKDTFENIVDMQ